MDGVQQFENGLSNLQVLLENQHHQASDGIIVDLLVVDNEAFFLLTLDFFDFFFLVG